MDSQRGLILWILGGSGIVLLYAAYKGQSPLAVVQNHVAASSTGTGTTASTSLSSSATATVLHSSKDGYVYDSNGNPVGVVPTPYRNNPTLYVGPGAAN